jgi:hypothetical protein
MSLPRPALAVGFALALLVTGCNGEDDEAATPAPAPSPEEEAPTLPPAPGQIPAEDPEAPQEGAAAPDGPVRPAPGSCVDLPEAPDGFYRVFEAGSAVVTREGDRLVLGAIAPAEGWEARVDDQDDDEIEIEFFRGDEELDLEVEIDDGRVEVEVCADAD